MGECNLDKIEHADFHENDIPKIEEDGVSHWDLLARNSDIPWKCEIPCTGENGNDIASSRRRIERIEYKPPKKNLANRFLKYYELLGQFEAS